MNPFACSGSSQQGAALANSANQVLGSQDPHSQIQKTPKSARKRPSEGPTKESPNTPKSSRSRYGWAPVIIKDRENYEILIFCKQTTGRVGPYTDSAPNSKHRVAWSPVSECEVIRMERKSEIVDFVRFKNTDNLQSDFRCDLLNMFIRTTTTQFARFCTKIQMEKRFDTLCLYISLLAHSGNFSCFKPDDVHSDDGFMIDGTGIQENQLKETGGSLSEYLQFKSLAKLHAIVISEAAATGGDGSKTPSRVSQNKRITDFFQSSCPPKKLSKLEEMELSFAQECSDKAGLEQRLTSEYVGWGSIGIDKLKCNDGVSLSINQQEVGALAECMSKRFDPSLAVLIVVKDDDGGNGEYFVLHGNHRLLALKLLDAAKKFEDLPGIVNRELQCFIVGAGVRADQALGVYCQIRSNDLGAKYQTETEIHELIFVFNDLNKSYKDIEKTKLVMERLAKLRKVGRDDRAALNKIFAWPQENLNQLIQVLQIYEVYQTIDGSGPRNRTRIQDGLKMPLTKEMLKDLGNCQPDFFATSHQAVLGGEISFRALLKRSKELKEIDKTKANVSKEAGFETFAALKQKYPEKVTEEKLKSFNGAVLTGKNKNPEGDRLKSFVKNLQKLDNIEDVKFVVINDFKDIDVEAFDTLVIQVSKDDMDYVESLIHLANVSRKDVCIMVIFESEKDYLKTILKLGNWEDEKRIKVSSVFFQKMSESSLLENLTFAVIFGRFFALESPLRSFYKNVETSLKKIVSTVSPQGSKIIFVTKKKRFCATIHEGGSVDSSYQISYLAPQILMDKFRLKRVASSVFDDIGDDLNVEEKEDAEEKVDAELETLEDETLPKNMEKQSSTSSTTYSSCV